MNTGAEMYLQKIINDKSSNYNFLAVNTVKNYFEPTIKRWSNGLLNEFFLAGSAAKGVAIKGKSDFDFFVSIKSHCTDSLGDMFNGLYNELTRYGRQKGFTVRKQNVSLGIKGLEYNGIPIDIDIVPGKQQAINSNFHSLYKSKQNSWTLTNVKTHIDTVKNSRRQDFIKLTKVWRDCHRVELPSINLELLVLEALRGCNYNISLEDGFQRVLIYLSDNIENVRLVDPCNTNNIVSEDMSSYEKTFVSTKARNAVSATNWRDVVW